MVLHLGRTAVAHEFALLVLALVPLVLATVLARRAPGQPLAAVLAAAGVCWVLAFVPSDLDPGMRDGTWMLLYLPFAILLLLVPDGRFATRGRAILAVAVTGVAALFILLTGLSASGPAEATAAVLLLSFFLLLALCAASPVLRYRGAGPEDRLQLRWVLLAGMSLPATLLLCWTSYLVLGGPDLVVLGLLLMYLAIPVSVTIAVLRPTLFDVDRAVLTTVAATLAGVLVLSILTVAGVVAGVALVDWSPWAGLTTTALATLAGVGAFGWLSRRLQHAMQPGTDLALRALEELRAGIDEGSAAPEEVQRVLARALDDPTLRIGYRGLLERTMHGLDGAPWETDAGPEVPLRVRGEEIGALRPGAAASGAPPPGVLRAVAPLVESARLRVEIERAGAEVVASRERIARAADVERSRLERDLHDGVQQRLVAIGMRLRVLQAGAGEDLVGGLDSAVDEVGAAVQELRRLAHGLRPAALDEGLGPALDALCARSPLPATLELRMGPLPDPVATAAYYVVSEALTNALRHAGATRITVDAVEEGGSLRVRVVDDGCGGARAQADGGLVGLADRVAAVGGHLRLRSAPGEGTVLEAVLPCGS